MNPVLILTHNNLDLTKRCVESVRNQDIETVIRVVDNASSDGTMQWLEAQDDIQDWYFDENRGVSVGWNLVLSDEFESQGANHVLVINNDAVLPPWFYSELLGYDFPFVTGVAVDVMPIELPKTCPPSPNPDFSAFLIRRECWKKIGPFDERMKLYCSDCDYHIRGYRLGIPMMKVNSPYFHINSQTIKRASTDERAKIEAQANQDREVFRSIYGCLPGTPAYYALFGDSHA